MKKILALFLGALSLLAGGTKYLQADGFYHYSGGIQNNYPNFLSFGKCYGYIGRYYPLDKQFTTPVPYYTPAQQSYGYPYYWQQQAGNGTSFDAPTAGYHYYPAMPNTMMPSYWYGR